MAERTAHLRTMKPPVYHVRRATGRTLLSLLSGALCFALGRGPLGWPLALMLGWVATSLVLLLLVWTLTLKGTVEETRQRAAADDPGRTTIWGMVLLTSSLSLFGAAGVLRQGPALAPRTTLLFTVCSVLSVVSAWVLTHTSYALRYAHLFYRDAAQEGGLSFPGERGPDDFDFAYFAFTIGMCFQVSDVTVLTPAMRKTVLGHALLSFAYNTVLVALAFNVLLGVLA